MIINTDNPGEDELVDQKVMEKEEVNDKVIKIVHFKNIVRKKIINYLLLRGCVGEENMMNIDQEDHLCPFLFFQVNFAEILRSERLFPMKST